MEKRSKLKEKLASIAPNQTLTYPTSINGPQISIHRVTMKKQMGWMVTVNGKKPFSSANIEHVTDYLLILRPTFNWNNGVNQFRDIVKMEDIF